MTTTIAPPEAAGASTSHPGRGRTPRLGPTLRWPLFLVAAPLLTLALHLFRSSESYDLFIDEPFYAHLGQSVALGHLPFAAGVHFFLHPPGFFYVEALWIKAFGFHSDIIAQVFSLRRLVAVFAALTVLMLSLILERVANRRAAAVGAGLYLINAFVQRDSGIVILETATMFWALAGYAVLLRLPEPGSRGRGRRLAVGGLLFGLSILTKEFAVFITMVPLLFVWLFQVWLSRREALLAMVYSAVPYLMWVAVVVASGHLHVFWAQVSSGLRRTAGSEQITGFNKGGTPTFLEALLKNAGYLWTAYVILGLGTLAILYLAWRPKNPQQRFIACCGLGAIPLISYCALIGTNEEQFFNFLLLPCLIALVTVCWNNWAGAVRTLKVFVLVVTVAVVCSDVTNTVVVRTVADDGTSRLNRWMYANVPDRTVVLVTNSVQREIFERYTMVNDAAGAHLNEDVRYLVVFYRQVEENYAFVDRATVDAQTRNLVRVFTTSDRSNGRMSVYAVR